MQASGRSLLSSSGSGHLAPAELAAMYPTPPPFEATLSVGSGGPCPQLSPTEVKPLLSCPSEADFTYPEEGNPRQREILTNAIVQSTLHNTRPIFDQEVVCFHRVSPVPPPTQFLIH